MQRFVAYPADGRQEVPDLQSAHLIGNDGVPVRGDVAWEDGAIVCRARTQDPLGLSLMWRVEGLGALQLQTTRLQPREKPYHLHIELARHLLMRIGVKREEWGLFDYSGMDKIAAQLDAARDAFIAALTAADNPADAARWADKALAIGLEAAAQMSAFHADVFLGRRQQTGGFAKPFLGVTVPPKLHDAKVVKAVAELCDYVRIPIVWRDVQPAEQQLNFDALDAATKLWQGKRLAVRGGPLLTFGVQSVPDWMYIWENDFESIYEAARDFVQKITQRYAKTVTSWIVASGLHADSVFGFSFEQIMELTRMAASVTRQTAPRSQVILDLTQPWGEYYAHNQRTIPPLLYADMAVQSGINFDGFGVQLLFGLDADGYRLRDPLQVSGLIDKLANLGKPLHITALGVPSAPPDERAQTRGGQWRAPWSEDTQADWLASLCEIALSKPYVESVCLQPLTDAYDSVIPGGGLFRADHSPKPAVSKLISLRKRLLSPPER